MKKTLITAFIGFLIGSAVGFWIAFSLLIGHMERHDRLYHLPGSQFGTNGVSIKI